jgi:hypothetical protein
MACSLVAVVVAASACTTASMWSEGVGYGVPFALVGIAFSLATWTLASSDRRAVRAKAMDASTVPAMRVGYVLGIIGTITAAALLGCYVAALIYESF